MRVADIPMEKLGQAVWAAAYALEFQRLTNPRSDYVSRDGKVAPITDQQAAELADIEATRAAHALTYLT